MTQQYSDLLEATFQAGGITMTPLMLAVQKDETDIVRYLVEEAGAAVEREIDGMMAINFSQNNVAPDEGAQETTEIEQLVAVN